MEQLFIQHPLYIPTGRTGQEQHVIKQVVQYSVQQGRMTLCEMFRLTEILESPDPENMNVVIAILEEKHKVKFV